MSIVTQGLPDAIQGAPYAAQLEATGGTPPYAWMVASGGLPDGLMLDTATGRIWGSPTNSGSWVFHYPFRPYVCVSDSGSASAAVAFKMAVIPAAAAPQRGRQSPRSPAKYGALSLLSPAVPGAISATPFTLHVEHDGETAPLDPPDLLRAKATISFDSALHQAAAISINGDFPSLLAGTTFHLAAVTAHFFLTGLSSGIGTSGGPQNDGHVTTAPIFRNGAASTDISDVFAF